MRIVTWNMGCGPRASSFRKHHDEAWAYLIQEMQPDIALLQEARVTELEGARQAHSVTICDLAQGVDAGTAVLVRSDLETRPAAKINLSDETYLATTSVRTPAGALVAVSVHIYTGKKYLDDLALISGPIARSLANAPVVLGGDFNAARVVGKRGTSFFEDMELAGVHDAHWAMNHREVASFWRPGTQQEIQDDHIFVNRSWASRVQSCKVVDNETVRRVSDHGPVVLELDVTAA